MDKLNTSLVVKSLGFHGQPLQKIWEGERGENDLMQMGIINPDYSTYKIRQKYLGFHDRAKRLKLHQFISKKAIYLFDKSLVSDKNIIASSSTVYEEDVKDNFSTVPYFETFLNVDKNKRHRYFFDNAQPGEIVYGSILTKSSAGFSLKILCTTGKSPRYLADLNVKAFLPTPHIIQAVDKMNVAKSYNTGDYVKCEIVEIVPDADKMIVTMKGNFPNERYGLIQPDEFPDNYKSAINLDGETYEELLENSIGFKNPYSVEVFSQELGLEIYEHYTNMSSLRGRFPQQEYSNELRQVQASKWAFRSVAAGIEHFKEGRHSEAFQCLNKALSIDPRNVEGLVARGALYANSGSFKKAVDDFETALKLNPSHANARKYMGETLVALGRSYEEENKIEEAKKAYQDCLAIIPHHEEAQNSLDFLKNKSGKQLFEPGELLLPALNLGKSAMEANKLEREASTSKRDNDFKKDKKLKKKKSKGNKKERRNSSSSSSSDSSDSSDSSSESSSSTDSSSSSDSESNSKKKRHGKKSKQKSMSPLSKRLAMMGDGAADPSNPFQFNQFGDSANTQEPGLDDYELKVRKFLEITRDEDDYEEKVRRFVEEASKYRKERKILEEKAKKKKKKEAKRLKKESKKRRREKDKEEKKKAKAAKKPDSKLDFDAIENKKIREALKLIENFPALDEIGTKLSSLLEKNNTSFEEELKLDKGRSSDPSALLYSSIIEDKGGKWKMAFAKDKKIPEPQPSGSKTIPKQYAFANESDTDDDNDTSLGAPVQHPPPPPPAATSSDRSRKRNHPSPRPRYPDNPSQAAPPSTKAVVKSGPVVLDKFGNFRLANMDNTKPPEPPGSPKRSSRSRSRSRQNRKYSSSRSRSRTPRKRSRSVSYSRKYSRSRSRSRSFRSRTRSRSRSRSYSRSRSRSRSLRRYGGDRRNFRGRGGAYNERGTYYKPRFSNHPRGRGGRGNYRDYRDYRGGRDRGRPFRPRAARGGNNSRYYRSFREGSRDRRYSRDRSEERDRRSYSHDRPRSPHENDNGAKKSPPSPPPPGNFRDSYKNDDRREGNNSSAPDIEGRWADNKNKSDQSDAVGKDASLEEMEKYISKQKKENKEEMIERNKDIVKKSNLW